MEQFLTDIQKAKIETFCADKEMMEAVRKVLLAGIYEHGTVQKDYTPNPLVNGAFSLVALAPNNPIPDEILGQQLRAQWSGINALKNAFDKLESITSGTEGDIESPFNEAE